MPLLTEREHMELWCPERRVLIMSSVSEAQRVQVPGGPPVDVGGLGAGMEVAPAACNALDMPTPGQPSLKIPQTCLCFGSHCGAWQWSPWHRGSDGKDYPSIEALKEKDPNMPGEQLGYCGKAVFFAPMPSRKASKRPEAPGGKDILPEEKTLQ